MNVIHSDVRSLRLSQSSAMKHTYTSELLVYQACEEAGPHGQVELFITVMEVVDSDLYSPSLAEATGCEASDQ